MSIPITVGVVGYNKLTVNYRIMQMSNPECSAEIRNVGSNQDCIVITVKDIDNPNNKRGPTESNSFQAGAIQVDNETCCFPSQGGIKKNSGHFIIRLKNPQKIPLQF